MNLLVAAMVLLLASCGSESDPAKQSLLNLDDASKPVLSTIDEQRGSLLKATKLEPFRSSDEFGDYLDALRAGLRARARERDNAPCSDCIDAGAPSADVPVMAPAPDAEAGGARGITNHQESGVDEGDIVKFSGDYLIVLRRGRLFSIRTTNDNAATLQPMAAIDAYPARHSTQTWYDELLLYENKIIVIGYSYGYGATEIGWFDLGNDGSISHHATHFLKSNDYYSSRNYASRLIGSKIVLYMPYYFFDRFSDFDGYSLPGQAQFIDSGAISAWDDIIDVATIIRPTEETLDPVLHTIATCDLARDQFACTATGVIGPPSRSFYVSESAVYLWTAGEHGSQAYRLPLNGDAPSAMRAHGVPTDQFSFKETSDGIFHVLLRNSGYGDAMWSPEFRSGAVALLTVPVAMFRHEPQEVAQSAYAMLTNIDGYSMHNRFIGDFVLFGEETIWGSVNDDVHVFGLKTKVLKSINLGHDVQRIEALGKNALVVGSQDDNLVLSVLNLGDSTVADRFAIAQAAQGERRSHGFFFHDLQEGSGILGLPTRSEGSPFGELFETSAAVQYLSLNDLHLTDLGSLASLVGSEVDDGCKSSCVDWYGNSRPIFLGDRILGLMGYDLVEGSTANGRITEVSRVNFTPQPPAEGNPIEN